MANQHYQDSANVASSVANTGKNVLAAEAAEDHKTSAQGAAVTARKTRVSANARSVNNKSAPVRRTAASVAFQRTLSVPVVKSVERKEIARAAGPAEGKFVNAPVLSAKQLGRVVITARFVRSHRVKVTRAASAAPGVGN